MTSQVRVATGLANFQRAEGRRFRLRRFVPKGASCGGGFVETRATPGNGPGSNEESSPGIRGFVSSWTIPGSRKRLPSDLIEAYTLSASIVVDRRIPRCFTPPESCERPLQARAPELEPRLEDGVHPQSRDESRRQIAE
jgi:hypothetical protein